MNNTASGAAKTGRIRIFDALQFRKYQYYLTSAFLVYAARWMQNVVLGWLVLEKTNSAFMVGLAAAFQWVPMLLFGVVTGFLADKLNRRFVLIFAQIISAVGSLVLGFLIISDALQTWHIMTVSLLLGIAWAVDWPCRHSMIPNLVGKDNILNGIALDNSAWNFTSVLGSIAGGQLITSLGIGNCYFLIGATYLTTSFFLFLIGSTGQVPMSNDASIRTNLAEGIKYTFKSQAILAVLAITIIMNALNFPVRQLFPVFARDIMHVGPAGLGYIAAAPGAGAFLGTMFLAGAKNIRRTGMVFLSGSIMMPAVLILFAVSKIFPLSLALLVVWGLGLSMFGTFQSAILVNLSTEQMRGRVMGILSLCIGAMPLGITAFGAFTDIMGAPTVVVLGAILAGLLTLAVAILMPGIRKH